MDMLEIYIISFAIPFAIFGFIKAAQFIIEVLFMKSGKVKSWKTTENGQIRKKWIKPESGQIKSNDGASLFKYDVGYIWRDGFFPTTFIDGRTNTQLDLLNKSDQSGAKDASLLIIRGYNEGYIDGFKKNKMINNLIMVILIASVAAAAFGLFSYQQNTNILNILKAKT